uniref:HECT-type E3 ubiquitin transferase n=1 Tax=Palpitomonas bilix TaxID=652834 RepID=A0A7S3DE09_9EUKA
MEEAPRMYSKVLPGCKEPLFTVPVDEKVTVLHINPKATGSQELKYLKLCGALCARSVFVGVLRNDYCPLPFRVARSMFADILQVGVSCSDFAYDMPLFFRHRVEALLRSSLVELGMDGLLTFTCPNPILNNKGEKEGEGVEVEVMEGGNDVEVTDDNKLDYLNMMAEFLLKSRCEKGLEAFTKGFEEVFPRDHFTTVSSRDMELLVCGTSGFDLADFRNNVSFSVSSQVREWLCEALGRLNDEEKGKFLQFVTGSSKLPGGGFSAYSQRVTVLSYGALNSLPQSHTCFNQLVLPQYSDAATLQSKLLLAINEGCEGFGMA